MDNNSKRVAPRAETMQSEEAKVRLTPHYLPDYDVSVMAESQEDAVKKAKKLKEKEVVNKDQDDAE